MIEHRTVPLGQWRASLLLTRADGFTTFDQLTAVDQLDDSASPGIDLVAHLLRPGEPIGGAWLRTRWHEGLTVRSCSDLWAGAAWHEREVHEMFGISFDSFDDATGLGMRPLLLAEDAPATPLRKSVPLLARGEREWPGLHEPDGRKARSGRRTTAPGVPGQELPGARRTEGRA